VGFPVPRVQSLPGRGPAFYKTSHCWFSYVATQIAALDVCHADIPTACPANHWLEDNPNFNGLGAHPLLHPHAQPGGV